VCARREGKKGVLGVEKESVRRKKEDKF